MTITSWLKSEVQRKSCPFLSLIGTQVFLKLLSLGCFQDGPAMLIPPMKKKKKIHLLYQINVWQALPLHDFPLLDLLWGHKRSEATSHSLVQTLPLRRELKSH